MSDLNHCRAGGVLVGPEQIFGPTPHDYAWPLADVPIGCNRLRCRKCGELVRSGNKFGPGPEFNTRWLEALRAPDWNALAASGVLKHDSIYRLYVCGCLQHAETLYRYIEEEEAWQVVDPPPPWRCDGHPRLALPADVDGIAIGPATDFAALVSRAFAETLPREVTGVFGDHWLSRLFHLIKHDPAGEKLSRAVLAELTASSDPSVRVEALDFFRRNPSAPGAGELLALGRAQRDRFAGVVNPKAPETDLLYFLLQALACQIDEGDRAPLEFLQEQMLEPGPKPGYLVDVLKRHAPDWIQKHRGQILAANLQLARQLQPS